MSGKKHILVFGGGVTGRRVAAELAKTYRVTVADCVPLQPIQGCNTLKVDVSASETYESLLAQSDVVVGCLPGHITPKIVQKVLKYSKPFVDASYTKYNYKAVDQYAKSAKCTILYDCGFSPGIPNLIVGHALAKYRTLSDVKIRTGGISLERSINSMGYVPTSSLEDLYERYTTPARFVYNGKVKTGHPLYTPEAIFNDECNVIRTDGLRSLLSLRANINNMEDLTVRWAGHMGQVKKVIDSYWEREIPEDKHKFLFMQDMERLCTPRGKDWTMLDIQIQTEFVKHQPLEFKIHTLGNNAYSNCCAMVTCAMVEALVERMFTETGCFPPEHLGAKQHVYKFVFEYLSLRGVELLS